MYYIDKSKIPTLISVYLLIYNSSKAFKNYIKSFKRLILILSKLSSFKSKYFYFKIKNYLTLLLFFFNYSTVKFSSIDFFKFIKKHILL